jgi:16S rRNA (uracil1498-N3)-methyltransferase
MTRPEQTSLPRCFGQIAGDGQIRLDPDEEHHLLRVLRVAPGDRVEVIDGGRLALAEVAAASRRDLRLHVVGFLEPEPLGAVPIRLCAAVLHPPAMERLVRLAAELHVMRITPLLTERTQHRQLPARLLERWRRIAQEACKQARRLVPPPVDEPLTLERLLAEPPPESTLRLCLTPHPAELDVLSLGEVAEPAQIWLLQGPEGGWTEAELERIAEAGARSFSLGRAVFRAETCPLVALSLLHARFGDLLRPWPDQERKEDEDAGLDRKRPFR